MPKIVLSYRSDGRQESAWRMRDRLREIYREISILDDASSSGTETLTARVADTVAEADLLLVIVDPGWVDSILPHLTRLDVAAIAIETALKTRIPIIAIVLDGASMPKPAEIPFIIREFAFCGAVRVANRDVEESMQRIVKAIDDILGRSPNGSSREIAASRPVAAQAAVQGQPLSLAELATLYAATEVTPVGALTNVNPELVSMADRLNGPVGESVLIRREGAHAVAYRARRTGSLAVAFTFVTLAGLSVYFFDKRNRDLELKAELERQRAMLASDRLPPLFGPSIVGGEPRSGEPNFACVARSRAVENSSGPDSIIIEASANVVQLYRTSFYPNLSFRARIEFLPGTPHLKGNGHAGLIFHASKYDDFYTASVFPDGAFGVFHRQGEAWNAVVPKTNASSAASNPKSGATVQINLAPLATEISVNGVWVPYFGFPGIAEGQVGFYAAAGSVGTSKWEFSNVLVRCGPPERNIRPAVRKDRQPSVVDLSAFSPETGCAGEGVLVQVFLHKPPHAATAAAFAHEADPQSRRRGVATLETEIAVGQKVEIRLDAPGLNVDDAIQRVVWRGEPRACQFLVTFPADASGRAYPVRVRVIVASVPVGKLMFQLRGVAPEQAADATVGLRGEKAQRFRQAFLSYASADRVEVLKGAQYLRAAGIGFFQDLLSLEAGEHWAPRIYQEIDRCDLFLLCWSSHASRSEWVIKEAEYALSRHNASGEELPEIIPMLLEGPPVPPPPQSLKDIHFNDPLRYVIFAEEQSRRAT
jgi:hypothetical protein